MSRTSFLAAYVLSMIPLIILTFNNPGYKIQLLIIFSSLGIHIMAYTHLFYIQSPLTNPVPCKSDAVSRIDGDADDLMVEEDIKMEKFKSWTGPKYPGDRKQLVRSHEK